MERLNMKYDRLNEILDACNLDELDSIDILLTHVKKYDLKLTNMAFRNTQQKKWDKYRSEYEGMNEYDYITRINNFDISTTFDFVILNPYELVYLKQIMEDAIINIKNNKNAIDLRIVPNIQKSLEKINVRLNELTNLNNIITDDELEIMLNKFNPIEIESLDNIFEYIELYNIENIMKISNKVYNEKVEEESKKFSCHVRPYNYDIIDLCYKKDELSEKELELLSILLEDACVSLYSSLDQRDEQKYKKCSELVASLSNLQCIYSEELHNRNSKVYKNKRINRL